MNTQYLRKIHYRTFREVYPTLLHKSYRGKYYNAENVPSKYGENKSAEGVEGIELLEAYERGEIIVDEDGEVVFREDEMSEESISDDEEAPELVEIEEENEESEEEAEDDDAEEDENGEMQDNDNEEEEEAMEEEDSGEWEDVESEEENDGSDDEGWEDVSHDSSDNEADKQEAAPAPSQTSIDNIRNRVDSKRILTPSDFELLNRLKAAVVERMKDPKRRSQKHKAAVAATSFTTVHNDDDDDGEKPANPFMVSPDALVPTTKLARATKMERLEKVLSGQKDNKFELGGHAGGLTNKEKLRKKNFLMVRRGKRAVANKIRESKRKKHDVLTTKTVFLCLTCIRMCMDVTDGRGEERKIDDKLRRQHSTRTFSILCIFISRLE